MSEQLNKLVVGRASSEDVRRCATEPGNDGSAQRRTRQGRIGTDHTLGGIPCRCLTRTALPRRRRPRCSHRRSFLPRGSHRTSTSCSNNACCSRGPTCTWPQARRPPCASTACSARSRATTSSTAAMIERLVFAILNERKVESFDDDLELDTSYAIPGKSRFRMNVFRQRGAVGAVLRTIPFDIPDFDSLHLPAVIRIVRRPATRSRAGDRTDGLRKVDDAGLAARHHQPDQAGAHPVVRGPDRVPVHPQDGDRQPTRGRRRHQQLRIRIEAGPARGPRRDPRRRDARPGDDPHGAHRGGDRAPRVRHAAHPVGAADRRPHRRRVPARPARPDPGDAGDDVASGRHPAAASQRRRPRPRRSRGDPHRHPGGTQPDP